MPIPVQVQIHADPDGPSAGWMRITGRVVHAIPNGNGYRVGISFTRMEEPDRALIRRLIAPAPLVEDRRRKARVAVTQTVDEP